MDFTESYVQSKSYKKHKNSTPNENKKHFHEKKNSPKRPKRRFSPDIKKMKKIHLNDNITNLTKHNRKHHQLKKREISIDFFEEIHFRNKSQDKPITKNFVNQKFRIADDFNEENSNQFLTEKDECLKEVILSDKIENEKIFPFNEEDEKEDINHLSSIKKTKMMIVLIIIILKEKNI